mmetsp:Transcript_33227/g.62038  ORF Transcript_33227/g.62038 Transcript_33227/m.62038 type:complete len:97 (+) Transcript_33227:209-499(+)
MPVVSGWISRIGATPINLRLSSYGYRSQEGLLVRDRQSSNPTDQERGELVRQYAFARATTWKSNPLVYEFSSQDFDYRAPKKADSEKQNRQCNQKQ